MPAYLVGRVADPVLGLSTGVLAYYLWEYDGRNEAQRPQGRRLIDLLQRRWNPPATGAGDAGTEGSRMPVAGATARPESERTP